MMKELKEKSIQNTELRCRSCRPLQYTTLVSLGALSETLGGTGNEMNPPASSSNALLQ